MPRYPSRDWSCILRGESAELSWQLLEPILSPAIPLIAWAWLTSRYFFRTPRWESLLFERGATRSKRSDSWFGLANYCLLVCTLSSLEAYPFLSCYLHSYRNDLRVPIGMPISCLWFSSRRLVSRHPHPSLAYSFALANWLRHMRYWQDTFSPRSPYNVVDIVIFNFPPNNFFPSR